MEKIDEQKKYQHIYQSGYRAGKKAGKGGPAMNESEFFDAAFLAAITGMVGLDGMFGLEEHIEMARKAANLAMKERRKFRPLEEPE